jgi:hypothetical protein
LSEVLSSASLEEDEALEALSRSVSEVSIGGELQGDSAVQQARAASVAGSVYDGYSEHEDELRPLSRSVSGAPPDGEYQGDAALHRARNASVAASRYSYGGDYGDHIQVTRDSPPDEVTPEDHTPRAAASRGGSYLGLPGQHASAMMQRSASGSSRHSDRTVKAGDSTNVSTVDPMRTQTDYSSQRNALWHMGLSSATPTPLPSVAGWPGTPGRSDGGYGYGFDFADSENPNVMAWLLHQSRTGSSAGPLSPVRQQPVASPERLGEPEETEEPPRMIRGLSTVIPAARSLASGPRSPEFEATTVTGATHSTLRPTRSVRNQFTGSRTAPVARANSQNEFVVLDHMLSYRYQKYLDSQDDFVQQRHALKQWKNGDTSEATMKVVDDLRAKFEDITRNSNESQTEITLLEHMLCHRYQTLLDSRSDYEQRSQALALLNPTHDNSEAPLLNHLRIEYGRATGEFQWDPEEVFFEDPK